MALVYDVTNGNVTLDEAVYEYKEYVGQNDLRKVEGIDSNELFQRYEGITKVVDKLLDQANYSSPPLYLPEIISLFPFITVQTMELGDRFSRILNYIEV